MCVCSRVSRFKEHGGEANGFEVHQFHGMGMYLLCVFLPRVRMQLVCVRVPLRDCMCASVRALGHHMPPIVCVGRGLMATRNLKAKDKILTVPLDLCISRSTAVRAHRVGVLSVVGVPVLC